MGKCYILTGGIVLGFMTRMMILNKPYDIFYWWPTTKYNSWICNPWTSIDKISWISQMKKTCWEFRMKWKSSMKHHLKSYSINKASSKFYSWDDEILIIIQNTRTWDLGGLYSNLTTKFVTSKILINYNMLPCHTLTN